MITKFSHSTYKNKAVPYNEIFPTIEDWLENCDYIVGHNILGFDMYLIKNYYEAMGKPYQHLVDKVIDTYCLAKAMKMDIQHKPDLESITEFQYKLIHLKKKGIKTSLKQMGMDFSIEHDYANLHNALVDLELNLKVWNKLKWSVEV
jgi:DNA polymerase III epsilon subunit-like protein